MRRKLTISILTSFLLLSFWQLTTNVSAQSELTLGMILTGLQTQGKTSETSTIAKRNIYITKKVLTYGVTFRLTAEIEAELRRSGASAELITAIRLNGPAQPTPVRTPVPTSRATATFKDIWLDYDVKESGQDGMRIHLKFTAYGMKNLDSYLAIYFKDSNGNYLKDKNNKFVSSAGEVAVYRDLKPGYDPADYDDFSVFMPYDELDLTGSGNWKLELDIKLIYKAGGLIQELTKKKIDYKQGDSVTKDPESVTFKVIRKWVDYDVTEGGQRGMRVHLNFEVTGLKDVDSKMSVRVLKADGTVLKNNNSGFSNDDGELEVDFEMKPGFPTAVYKDADVFLPYNQINVSKGKYTLTLDYDLRYEDGTLIKHMTTEEFDFDRP